MRLLHYSEIRGLHESRPLADLVTEARNLAACGVREINLIAQDLTAYGRDLDAPSSLAALLRELSAVEEGLAAYEELLAKLVDVPTPAGPTPRQLNEGCLVQLKTSATVPSLHSGLSAPPSASQASVPGGDCKT